MGLGVKIDHDLRAKALDFASSRVLQCLHYSKALVSHMIHLRENNQWLVEMRFVQEVDVDISNHHVHVVPVLSLSCSLLEIVAFAQVEELKIDRVINKLSAENQEKLKEYAELLLMKQKQEEQQIK